MESFAPLLEKTRVPQPSLQKFAVISIFSKLRSAPKYLDPQSEPGRDAIAQCLNSSSSAVVDQSIRELCRLVTDSVVGISLALLELQSALEGTDPKFVAVFVKGLGFLVRLGFQKNNALWRTGCSIPPRLTLLLRNAFVTQPYCWHSINSSINRSNNCRFFGYPWYYGSQIGSSLPASNYVLQ